MFSSDRFIKDIQENYTKVSEYLMSAEQLGNRRANKQLLSELDSQLLELYSLLEEYSDDLFIEEIHKLFNSRLSLIYTYSSDINDNMNELLMIILELPIAIHNLIIENNRKR